MKQKTYSGTGMINCLNICKKYNLTKSNSDLKVNNPSDLNSKWTIIVK